MWWSFLGANSTFGSNNTGDRSVFVQRDGGTAVDITPGAQLNVAANGALNDLTLTGIAASVNLDNIMLGTAVTGTNVAAGTVVTAVDNANHSATLSQALTGAVTSVNFLNINNSDKPWIAVDTNPGSPQKDNVYVSWDYLFGANGADVRYARLTGAPGHCPRKRSTNPEKETFGRRT